MHQQRAGRSGWQCRTTHPPLTVSFHHRRPLSWPPAARVTVGGYSFLVRLLSFMEYDTLYKTLPQSLPPAT